jgi:uncharacterized protein YpuA (DUF1002 family)
MKLKNVAYASLALPFLLVGTAFANSNVQEVIDEAYVQPDYVVGYSLNQDQLTETLSLLSYNEGKDNQLKILTTDAYSQIMDVDGSSLQLYSSVKIEKLGASQPLTVTIATPNNITKVTEDMYRNAAVTLGITHAKITVASPIAVTGESALAGIYYSLEENGAAIPQENKELASEELTALSTINAENEGKDGYDADKLNVALTEIKAAVAELADKTPTREEIEAIVEEKLAKYDLKNTLDQSHINLIVNFALNLSNSNIITSSDFVEGLTSLKDSIVANAKSAFEGIDVNAEAEKAKGFFAKIWQQIVDFFTNLGQ